MSFNAKEVKDKCVEWIREWFKENGNQCKAVIGISGGVDSSVVAALCVEALGKEKVYGVLMPQNSQDDIDYSYELCEHLGIEHCVIDIGNTVEDMLTLMYIKSGIKVSNQTEINIPARVRMVMLYAISQSIDGRVANTCNLSENYVGYSTKYGDAAGDFSPLESLTKTEVKAIGKELGLPERLVVKVPTDGLCGKTDEENLGFSYDVLDKYIREGIEPEKALKASKDVKEAEIVEEPKTIEEESKVEVPAPNYTTTEAEKGNVTFQAKPIEIVPSEEIKPDVDIQKVVSNLSDKDYDVQAKQMEEIAKISLEDSKNVIPYVTKEVFMSLIDILQKDTSELTPPTQEQINNRKKIILNEIVKEQAEANKEDVSKIELPYTLTKEEESSAKSLSEMELAERNKEYALYTMAVLSKVYTDEIFEHSGNIVPMTDLPGISTVVDTLRYNQNFEIKIAAIDALRYIERPEYKDELISLFTLAAGDESPYVARSAVIALSNMEDKK